MNIKTLSSHKSIEPVSSVLYIVGTPIGNLSDLSLRALNILKNVSFIACEDTRQTKKIMSKYEITNNLISFNKYNSRNKTGKIINYLNSITRKIGLSHNPIFKAFVNITNSKKYAGIGKSKKIAQQNAAVELIKDLNLK